MLAVPRRRAHGRRRIKPNGRLRPLRRHWRHQVAKGEAVNVVSIGSESVLDFIRREGGVTNTGNVAARFAWTMEEARRQLRLLERQGHIERPALVAHPATGCGGGILEWKLKESTA